VIAATGLALPMLPAYFELELQSNILAPPVETPLSLPSVWL